MTLNDLERPIHLKVRLADGTLGVRMLWLSLAGGHFENFKWSYFCNALSASLYVCTHTLPSDAVKTLDAYEIRHLFSKGG